MGWQDRDYARDDYYGPGRPRGGALGGLWNGSTVSLIVGINVALHLLAAFTTAPRYSSSGILVGHSSPIYEWGVMQGRAVMEDWQVWRIFTATYLHSPGWMHILMNMIGLWFLGPPLERRWGRRKFFVIYTIGGVLGNIALLFAARVGWLSPATPALGASGSVLALLGAAAVLFPHAEVLVYFLFPVRIRTAAIVFGLLYVYNIQLRGANFGGDICHLAGLLFGSWWAWRGDGWWSRTRFAWPRFRMPSMRRAPREREAQPQVWSGVGDGPWGRKVRAHADRQREVDRILAKVYDGGIGSLTPDERQTLREATDQAQQEGVRGG